MSQARAKDLKSELGKRSHAIRVHSSGDFSRWKLASRASHICLSSTWSTRLWWSIHLTAVS